MSGSQYFIRKKALEDLERIWIYTAKHWSLKQADRYYKLIIDEIEFVADHFMSGKSLEHLKHGYRSTIVKSHIIFYKKAEDDKVEIVRILHQRMDIENQLDE